VEDLAVALEMGLEEVRPRDVIQGDPLLRRYSTICYPRVPEEEVVVVEGEDPVVEIGEEGGAALEDVAEVEVEAAGENLMHLRRCHREGEAVYATREG